MAEGEFNRYYLRALCLSVLAFGGTELEIYRAGHSRSPRPGSEAMIGRRINAQALLDDLRAHPGVDASRPQFRPQRETYLLVRDAPACFCVEPKRSKTPFQRGYVKSQRS